MFFDFVNLIDHFKKQWPRCFLSDKIQSGKFGPHILLWKATRDNSEIDIATCYCIVLCNSQRQRYVNGMDMMMVEFRVEEQAIDKMPMRTMHMAGYYWKSKTLQRIQLAIGYMDDEKSTWFFQT